MWGCPCPSLLGEEPDDRQVKQNLPQVGGGRGTSKGKGSFLKEEKTLGTSLGVQWLRIRLPKQGTRVRALVQEDPTCHGATKPVCHNY